MTTGSTVPSVDERSKAKRRTPSRNRGRARRPGGRPGDRSADDTALLLHLLGSGDHVVACADLYGGTWRLFEGPLKRFGLRFTWVDLRDAKRLTAALNPETRMVWVETPSNPTLRLTDLRAIARRLKGRSIRLVVDNTFMSPLGQRPLAKRQMSGSGGVVSFELATLARARRFFSRLRLFTLAESLGGVESMANHPATMTHAAMSRERRDALGVVAGLCRLSVGIEAVADLIADLDQALGRR